MTDPTANVTQILEAIGAGDRHAAEALLPAVYDELRALAQARMAKTPPGNTLQPTALVHEAYLRVVKEVDPMWDGRGHFFGAAARAMRDILVDQARRKAAIKHGGDRKRVDAEFVELPIDTPAEDMLALNEALERLEADDPVNHQVVMLRFFAGLSAAQTADVMDVSERTIERRWRYARARLHKELGDSFTNREGRDE